MVILYICTASSLQNICTINTIQNKKQYLPRTRQRNNNNLTLKNNFLKSTILTSQFIHTVTIVTMCRDNLNHIHVYTFNVLKFKICFFFGYKICFQAIYSNFCINDSLFLDVNTQIVLCLYIYKNHNQRYLLSCLIMFLIVS